MLADTLTEAALGLFSICAIAAATDMLIRDARAALTFRSICALAAAVSALRLVTRLLGLWA
ncbi:MAG: hypothetical protein IJ769_06835 [Clostridia bacterium]|nr:hypothetical protein [Clostridia bacterium]